MNKISEALENYNFNHTEYNAYLIESIILLSI